MLQVSYIKENFLSVISNLNKRNVDFAKELKEITELDDSRKKIQFEYDSILNESNNIAKEIGILYKSGKSNEAEALKSKSTSCLLYTSPSPRDLSTSRMPSSA